MTENTTLPDNTGIVTPPLETTAAVIEQPQASVAVSPPVLEPETLLGKPSEPNIQAAPEASAKGAENATEKTGEAKPDTPAAQNADAGENKEGIQSDGPAQLPTYEAFQLPEDFALDEERINDFKKALGEFEIKTKADNAEVQKFGQSLMNRYVTEVQNAVESVHKSYKESVDKIRNDWKESFFADPEIGGNRKDTTVSAALEFIRTHGGSKEQQTEFHTLMNSTGIGNHPAMIRMLASAARTMAEGKPIPARMPVNSVKNKIEKRYGAV